MLRELIGNAVVVDDKSDEMNFLLELFEEESIFFKKFDGSYAGLPKSPLVRLDTLFLDMHLEGMDGKTPKEIASRLIAVIQKIVSPNNGPYTLVLWTTHENEVNEIIDQIYTIDSSIRPFVFIKGISKQEIIDGSKDLISELQNRYVKSPLVRILHHLIKVNRRTLNSSVSTLRDIPKISREQFWGLVKKIAIGYYGENKLDELVSEGEIAYLTALSHIMDQAQRGHMGYELANRELYDELEVFLREGVATSTSGSEEIQGRVNSWLFFSRTQDSNTVSSGNLYKWNQIENIPGLQDINDQIAETIAGCWSPEIIQRNWTPQNLPIFLKKLKEVTKNTASISPPNLTAVDPITFVIQYLKGLGVEFVFLEISAVCDDSQRKWKQNRLLPGVLIPFDNISSSALSKIKKSDALYLLDGKISLDNKLYYVSFDLRFLHTISPENLKGKTSSFAVGIEHLSLIQSKCSNHQVRPGVIILSDS